MKKYFFSLFLPILFVSGLSAQEELIDLLAEKTCACAAQKDLSNLGQEELNMELSMCIMASMSEHADKINQLNIDLTDQAGMNKFGEQIGLKMATKCPGTLMKIGSMQVENSKAPAGAGGEMTGTIKRLEGDEFTFVILADEQGREHRFLWLRYFPGSERLVNAPQEAIGKKVTLQFSELESYSSQAKDYFKRREIKSIQF